ncbi:hypothetical protein D3OALGA1CA_4338 [Olavius algarvensis associated proteobacterium Delta 3]|nr:hypothetical protein D3OALGA1CA_4338 [Olavius algarvensis associated proteobacterium Delta 3]
MGNLLKRVQGVQDSRGRGKCKKHYHSYRHNSFSIKQLQIYRLL